MRFVFAILLWLGSSALVAQIPSAPNKVNALGNKIGEWVVLKDSLFSDTKDTSNAHFFRVINYRNGVPRGLVRDFFINGTLQWEGRLISENPDLNTGLCTWYYPSGGIQYTSVYEEGIANGPYRQYYESGNLFQTYSITKGSIDGERRFYHENGEVFEIDTLKNGLRIGGFVVFYEDGTINLEGIHKNDMIDGELRIHPPDNDRIDIYEDGRIISAGGSVIPLTPNLLDTEGKRHGKWRELYNSNDITLEENSCCVNSYRIFNYNHGKLKGRTTEYYFDGTQYMAADLVSSIPDSVHGTQIFYFPDGNPEVVQKRFYNQIHGTRTEYYTNGKVKAISEYINGDISGPYIDYYDNGQVWTIGAYKNGKLDGSWELYWPNGEKKSDRAFSEGLNEGLWTNYHENGGLKSTGSYSKGKAEGKWEFYHDNGQAESIGEYKNDLKEGTWLNYYSNAQLWYKGTYVSGSATGFFEYYHDNGNQMFKGNLENGEWQGEVTEYLKNGTKYSSGNYINDQKTGFWQYFHENGEVSSEGIYQDYQPDGIWKRYSKEGVFEENVTYEKGLRISLISLQDTVNGYYNIGRPYQALPFALKLDSLLQVSPDASIDQKLENLSDLGRIYYLRDENDLSTKRYQDLLETCLKYYGDTSKYYLHALGGIANNYGDLGKHKEAREIYNKLLSNIEKKWGVGHDQWALYKMNIAFSYNLDEMHDSASYVYENTLELYEKHNPSGYMYYSRLFGMADYYYTQQLYNRSGQLFEKLVSVAVQAGDSTENTFKQALRKLARISTKNEDYTRGKHLYNRGLKIYQYQGDTVNHQYVEFLTGLASIHKIELEYDKSLQLLERGKLIIEVIPDARFAMANLYNVMGEVYHELSDNHNAARLFRKSCKILEDADLLLNWDYQLAAQNAATTYSVMSMIDSAKIFFEKALKTGATLNELAWKHQWATMNYCDFLVRNNKHDLAIQVLRTNWDIVNTHFPDDPSIFGSWNDSMGSAYMSKVQYDSAAYYTRIAAESYLKNIDSNPSSYCYSLQDLGEIFERKEEYDSAGYYYALGFSKYIEMQPIKTMDYFALGEFNANHLKMAWKFAEAKALLTSLIAEAKTRMEPNHSMMMRLKEEYAATLSNNAEAELSNEIYAELLPKILSKYGRISSSYSSYLYEVGWNHYILGNHSEAEALYKEQIDIDRQVFGDSSGKFLFDFQVLGKLYYDINQYENAEIYLKKAMELSDKNFGPQDIRWARSASYLTDVYMAQQKYRAAELIYTQLLEIYRSKLGETNQSYLTALEEFGEFYMAIYQYDLARSVFVQLAELYEESEDWKNLANIYNRLSWSNWLMKNYNDGLKYSKQAIQYLNLTQEKDSWDALAINNLRGIMFSEMGQLDSAEYEYLYAMKIYEEREGKEYYRYGLLSNNLSLVRMKQNRFEEALELLDRGYKITEPEPGDADYISALDNYAQLYMLWGKEKKATEYWTKVLDESLTFIRSNFTYLSEKEKANFWKSNQEDFEIFNTHAEQYHKSNPSLIGRMYDSRLATKAILLKYSRAIRDKIVHSDDTELIGKYYEWIGMREKLANYYTVDAATLEQEGIDISSMENITNSLEKELQDKLISSTIEESSWRDIQKNLKENEAAIEIVRYRKYNGWLSDTVHYAALIITKETVNQPDLVILKNGNDLEGRYFNLYRNSIKYNLPFDELYTTYWEPIKKYIKGKNQVYISMDGVYNEINLNGLKNPNGEYLIDELMIHYVHNTSDIISLSRKEKKLLANKEAVLIGFPTYNLKGLINKTAKERGSMIGALPGTRLEVLNIQNSLDQASVNAQIFMEENATEENVKAVSGPNLLHIATHGFFVDKGNNEFGLPVDDSSSDPLLRSGLLFAGASDFNNRQLNIDEENGILTAYEAANLNLEGTELVVLSACETGKGVSRSGEGVYGLQRAFQVAGAEAVIMSLWKVSDDATQELMENFYTHWVNSGELKSSFRKAQIQLREKYADPFYWSAFVIVGK